MDPHTSPPWGAKNSAPGGNYLQKAGCFERPCGLIARLSQAPREKLRIVFNSRQHELSRDRDSSCKRRGFCPSCGGRRMAELAAHLVDAVLPYVPVRQWVLTLPHRLRYLLAWNHKLCRAVLGVIVRAVLAFYRRRAGRTGVRDGRSGAVTVIQRFGGRPLIGVNYSDREDDN